MALGRGGISRGASGQSGLREGMDGKDEDGLLFEEIADDDDDVSEEPMAWIGVDACGEWSQAAC
ncbi:hypothetical protein M431DRAFT_493595 [Trichoderma harzianum CBS 226.95]|uniref:Uncharacterized protein n=1 Tax=Trichoderma harzianum CBS 226.95 TaxID=983964 RepID=A0A2T4AJ95_TRIHA|nr:hypothetical protein M431DRAFT_493595 [Trichoderma harzianum CBS 226.95]PTB57117.1 hypothetical protein M431DRAFT_493595 [Trichoderma harzianum CBS 226.95]